MTANGSALLRYAMIISVQKLTQVINQTKNTETQQENTKENTKKSTEINRDWSKKISWLVPAKTYEMSQQILKMGMKTLKHS